MMLATLVVALAVTGEAAQKPARTTRDGVYTAKQAERGKASYTQACAGCHALAWYRGEVMKPWTGAPLGDLYEAIATTMPQNNPASLKRREYLDILAYILFLNDMPTGSRELPETAEALKKIVVKWRSKP